jgi:tetratricopeptide (TPR) repeat protein
VKGWHLRGQIALSRRRLDEAETAFRQALAVAEAIGNPRQLWTPHAALGRLHAARGRHDQAGAAYRAAREVVDRVKAGLKDPGLRLSLERAPAVRELYDRAGPEPPGA